MSFMFGRKVETVKGILIENCKTGFKSCPMKKLKCDDGCKSCRHFDSKFFDGNGVQHAELTKTESCYFKQSGDKCPNGFETFFNNGVCKACVHFMIEFPNIKKMGEIKK